MKNTDLIESFLSGEERGQSSSLSIEGDKLYSYGTVIAQRIDGRTIVNKTKYSMTTTKSQNYLQKCIPYALTVEKVPMNTTDLRHYALTQV